MHTVIFCIVLRLTYLCNIRKAYIGQRAKKLLPLQLVYVNADEKLESIGESLEEQSITNRTETQ